MSTQWNSTQMASPRAGDGQPGPPVVATSRRISIYKRFLYLDSEQALNALACIDGGDIEERTQKILREFGGDLGINFTLGAAKIQVGGRGRRSVEEEIRRKRTAHSAVGDLLDRLREKGDLRRMGSGSQTSLQENDLVEFSGDIEIWPPGPWPVERPGRGVGPALMRFRRRDDPSAARRRELGLPRQFTARIPIGSTGRMAIMPLNWQYVVARSAAELTRKVTVVGQVEVMPSQHERLVVVFLAPDWSCGVLVHEAAVDPEIKDIVGWLPEYRGEWTMVHPLCIYK